MKNFHRPYEMLSICLYEHIFNMVCKHPLHTSYYEGTPASIPMYVQKYICTYDIYVRTLNVIANELHILTISYILIFIHIQNLIIVLIFFIFIYPNCHCLEIFFFQLLLYHPTCHLQTLISPSIIHSSQS